MHVVSTEVLHSDGGQTLAYVDHVMALIRNGQQPSDEQIAAIGGLLNAGVMRCHTQRKKVLLLERPDADAESQTGRNLELEAALVASWSSRLDADRYRWLRNGNPSGPGPLVVECDESGQPNEEVVSLAGRALDRAVDNDRLRPNPTDGRGGRENDKPH